MTSCVKALSAHVVFWLNLLFFIGGLGIIGTGVYVFVSENALAAWFEKELAIFAWVLGGAIWFVSMFALIGTRRMRIQKCSMVFYIVCLFVLIAGQIALVVFVVEEEAHFYVYSLAIWNEMTEEQRTSVMEEAECGKFSEGWADRDFLSKISALEDIAPKDAFEDTKDTKSRRRLSGSKADAGSKDVKITNGDGKKTAVVKEEGKPDIKITFTGLLAHDNAGCDANNHHIDCFTDCYVKFMEQIETVGSVLMIVASVVAGLEVVLLICSFILICSSNDADGISIYVGGGGGGGFEEEEYCGPISWIIGCCLFPCICFCPVDRRRKQSAGGYKV